MRVYLMSLLKKDLEKTNLTQLARNIGLKQQTLYRIVNGQHFGNMRTWELIADYYRGKSLVNSVTQESVKEVINK